MAFLKSRALRLAAFATTSLVLVGCANQPGFPGRDDELSRVRGQVGPFNVVSLNHERAVVSARGRQVAIEAADGFCVAKESIETSGRSAFAMIGDCILDDPQSSKRAAAASLPQGVPGIITVSISGDRGYTRDGEGAGSLSDLGEFLKTSEGRKMLGRGGAGQSVSIKESRTIDNGYYVLVEDKNTDLIPILAPRFWRSFVDLNDRLTVVTISGFKDKPLGSDEMLKYLVNQVKTLAYANREPLNETRTFVAEADTSRQDTPNQIVALADLEPEQITVTAEVVREEILSPVPQGRPAVEAEDVSSDDDTEVVEAPEDTDPSVALEIAAATATIPVPTPRGGGDTEPTESTEQNEPSGATEPQDTAESATPEAEETVVAASETTATPDAGATVPEDSVAPAEVSSANEGSADPVASQAQTTDPQVEVAADTDAAAQQDEGSAAADQQTVATTDQAVDPDPDTAPTANAPTQAPEAPKRPQRG